MIRAALDTNVLLAALRSRNGASSVAPAVIDRFLDALCAGADYFSTSSFWKPALPDEDDEAFAPLALEAKVGYLVTHNTRHFPANSLPTVQILTPKAFLCILRPIAP